MSRTGRFVRLASCAVVALSALFGLLPLQGDEAAGQGKAYALLVGVSTFDHSRLSELRYTENDVEELAILLDRPGSPFQGRVRVLTSARGKKLAADAPTAANIQTALRELTGKRTRGETVLVALASHGVELVLSPPDARSRGGLSRREGELSPDDRIYPFFCPSDAQFEGTDYATGTNERLINLNSLLIDTLGKSGAGTKLLLMDACREHEKLPAARSLSVNYKEVPEGVAAMFSCKSGQLAYEDPRLKHGVFFYFLLKGLSGEARDPATGKVTWERLSVYVGEAMESESKAYTGGKLQTPHKLANLVGGSPLLVKVESSALTRPDGPLPGIDIRPPRPSGRVAGKGISNSVGMRLMQIPKGKFMMGSAIRYDEQQHEVEISSDFYMGAYEVTQEEYRTVMGSNPSAYCEGGHQEVSVRRLDTSKFPVERVRWIDADEFCKTLSALPGERAAGRSYRLPTEAEWEYACRDGKREARPFHFGNMLAVGQANFDCRLPFGGGVPRNSLNQPCSVGNFEQNRFGLYDMHGNVREWCSDWFGKDYYNNSPRSDPQGPTKGSYRVVRGGSWKQDGNWCRSTHRDKLDPKKSDSYTGFRVVCITRP
jgi:formylglycine-generating enzyme required for sulfatase activity